MNERTKNEQMKGNEARKDKQMNEGRRDERTKMNK